MKKILLDILSKIPSVDYADIRIVQIDTQSIATKDGIVEALATGSTLGYGIRVLKDGAWGFAASNDFSTQAVDKTIALALQISLSSAQNKFEDIVLSEQKKIVASYKTPVKQDPFTVPFEDKIKLLLEADKAQRVHKNIVISQASFDAHRERKWFASTNGSIIDQEITWTGAGIEASASDGKDFQNRTYPNSFRGQNMTRGYESVVESDLVGNAARVGEEAVQLLTAPLCPTGTYDLILDSNQLALQIHESCGHATELDRVLGDEASYAGTSFLTPEKLGTFQYGSPIVNLTADATIPGGLGTFAYDDEGVPAQETYLVKKGVFVDYLTSRQSAHKLHQLIPSYNSPSNGTMRASSWDRIPLIRMTNVNLLPGEEDAHNGKAWTLNDMIADTKKGVFMSTNRSWSIDDRRLNFQFGTEVGWEIKDGKKIRMVKNPTYQGMTPQFWNSCNAIAGKKEWVVWGTPNCGKGQPSQVMYTGHGASPARFKDIQIGVVKKW
ncbi:MAG: TldD/PmbA family protein [Patescibacteria group bacterium]|jgi:TldD protein